MSNFLPTGIELTYLVAASLFIFGIKKLGSPATARQGNIIAAVGMGFAIIATLLNQSVVNYGWILVATAIGAIVGVVAAYKVSMTAMPSMVVLLHGLRGAASALVPVGESLRLLNSGDTVPVTAIFTVILGVLVGGITLTGSLVAYAKL